MKWVGTPISPSCVIRILGDAVVEHALAGDRALLLVVEGGGVVLEVLDERAGLGPLEQDLGLAFVDAAAAGHFLLLCGGADARHAIGGRNMAEVPCAGTGEKSIEKGDASVILTSDRRPHMAQQITYDKAYDTVAPEDFPAMLEVPRYGRRTDAFDSIISATHDHFWDPLDKNYIDFDQPFDMATTPIMPLDTVVELQERRRRPAGRPAEDPARQRRHALVDLQPAAWRAGRAVAVGQPVPHPARPGRAGIRRQPGARGGAPRRGLHPLHRQALGRAAAGRQDHRHRAGRPGEHAGGLQEDRRHADADRGHGDGRVRDAQRQDQRSGAAPAGPAGDERRGLPSPLRPHLGGQDHPAPQRGGAQEGRGLGGADLPDAAVQPDQRRAEAGDLRQVRARLAVGARRGARRPSATRTAAPSSRRAPTSSAC